MKRSRNDIPNVHIWTMYKGSDVKITLKFSADPIEMYDCRGHDEGWSEMYDKFQHCGEYISNEWGNNGSDCDGRTGSSGVSQCRLDLVNSISHPDIDYHISQWERAKPTSCYDQFAEAAGY